MSFSCVGSRDISRLAKSQGILHFWRPGGLGDVLMCTPVLREFKSLNPSCLVYFYTEYRDLVQGLPYIDSVHPTSRRPSLSFFIGYEHGIPCGEHLARVIGQSIGIRITDVRPDCSVSKELVVHFKELWKDMPHPHILFQRQASGWTPNKKWPEEYWRELLRSMSNTSTIIDIGTYTSETTQGELHNYIDLRGRTNLQEVVACIAAADILVAPDSGPIHIAAAVGTPAVIIMGGYILPVNTEYNGNLTLFTPIHCAPCWLRTPCPIDRKCLKMISPTVVEQAIVNIWSKRAASVSQ